jgi:hypothetical protein
MKPVQNNPAEINHWKIMNLRGSSIAFLPPIIFGLLGMLAILVNNLVPSIVLWSISSLIIILGGLYAVVKRLPAWGYTWAASGLMIIALVFKVAAEELIESGRYIISQAGDLGLMALIILAGLVLLITVSRKGWQPAGLVSIAYTSIFGISTLFSLYNAPFYRLDRALLAVPASLLFTLIIYFFLRVPGFGGIFLLALTWGITVGILYLAHITWQYWSAAQGRDTPLIPLLVLSAVLIISGPVIGIIREPVQKLLKRT